MTRRVGILSLLPWAAALGGCSREQLVVVVDTDALVAGQLWGREELSPDAVVDTARIEILGRGGEVLDVCERFAPDLDDWPISFGVAPSEARRYLRVRLFRRSLVEAGGVTGIPRQCGEPVAPGTELLLSDPPPEISIDHLIALPDTDGDQRRIALLLRLSCMGSPASFLRQRTCVEAGRIVGAADPAGWEGEPAGEETSRAGQSRLVGTRGCTRPPPDGVDPAQVVCIPGGFFIMGDNRLLHDFEEYLASYPLRPVYLSPFYIDRVEFSVGRMQRSIDNALKVGKNLEPPNIGEIYYRTALERGGCTWRVAGNDGVALPVNCISAEAAQAACQFEGGDLPAEAQWEYAARGRGRRWSYPWGDFQPNLSHNCCKSALSRDALNNPEKIFNCEKEYGPAPVGSHDGRGCPEGGDVSLDGVLDLAGNVAEYMRDDLRAYRERCGLQDGVTTDPVCRSPGSSDHVERGGSWFATPDWMALSARRARPRGAWPEAGLGEILLPSMVSGFRCVYPGE